MTNVVKRLPYNEQKKWFNKNNWSIFQSALVSKGVTTYRYPSATNSGIEEKLSLGNMSEPWQQIGQDINGEDLGDYFGDSVSFSADGSVVAVGANGNDDIGNSSGHVRVYELKEGSWQQLGGDIGGEAPFDLSGFSVSLSADGTMLAIGALKNDGDDQTDSNRGHVRVYQYNGSSWKQKGGDIDGEAPEDRSGYSVSLSADGSIVAIGAKENDGDDETDSKRGHVRVYEFTQGSWQQIGQDIDGEAADDESGHSVSLSADGSIVAIGAHFNGGNGTDSGHVSVYQYNGSSWKQKGGDIDGEAQGDESGYSVSLSADGSLVAIGAYGNNNGAGHVRVYQYNGSSWKQKGGDIDGEDNGDNSGWSVSLSADGSIVAIGARKNDGANGINSGHVRVYKFTGWGLGS